MSNIEEAERAIKAAQTQLENAQKQLAEAKKTDNAVDTIMAVIKDLPGGTTFKLQRGLGYSTKSVRFFVHNRNGSYVPSGITNANGFTYTMDQFREKLTVWEYTTIIEIDKAKRMPF